MGTLRKLKSALKKDDELRKMLVRSGRHEILLDLDGDQVPDIGLLDMDHSGDINAIAVDLTGNGEFNFYLVDNDGNGIPDEISFYHDYDDIPVKSVFGRAVEARLVQSVSRIHGLMTAVDLAAGDILDALEDLEKYMEEEYARFEEEGEDTVSAEEDGES